MNAPWSDEVVDALKWYQLCELTHPYTCICEGSPSMSVTKDGFVCEKCGHKQNWCMNGVIQWIKELKMLSGAIKKRKGL